MLAKLKSVLKGEKKEFQQFCNKHQLMLDYNKNKSEFKLLKDIFYKREYADYFPFYEAVTIVDIGAHYGYFSLFAHQNSAKNSQIFAIEPSSNNFNALVNNINSSKANNIQALNYAIGKTNEQAELFTSKNVNHSIVKAYLPNNNKQQTERVDVITLETFMNNHHIEQIDFLKLDCEGAEYDILFNCPSSIFQQIRTISMEFHDLKQPENTANNLIKKLQQEEFKIVKFLYEPTSQNQNYGKLIATKLF